MCLYCHAINQALSDFLWELEERRESRPVLANLRPGSCRYCQAIKQLAFSDILRLQLEERQAALPVPANRRPARSGAQTRRRPWETMTDFGSAAMAGVVIGFFVSCGHKA